MNNWKLSSFAIIIKNNKVLLSLRRDYNIWNLPGGGVENKESPWHAVKREVYEETGLFVDIKKCIGISHCPDMMEISFTFLCKRTEGKLILTEEASEHRFFDINQLPNNMSNKHKERILLHFEDSKNCNFSTQFGNSTVKQLNKTHD